ncbi:MAG: hypothetical protein MRY74_16490 [Neomegalonema sp.]|nr:hypothetical protein [Neomegalonema sp.]
MKGWRVAIAAGVALAALGAPATACGWRLIIKADGEKKVHALRAITAITVPSGGRLFARPPRAAFLLAALEAADAPRKLKVLPIGASLSGRDVAPGGRLHLVSSGVALDISPREIRLAEGQALESWFFAGSRQFGEAPRRPKLSAKKTVRVCVVEFRG